MKAISNTKMLGATPRIILTHKLLQSIKHVVNIAPQEAQWFHTINYNKETNEYLLDGIYIPEQICSAAEVDSSSTMMVQFYKDLAKDHGPAGASQLLSNMGAWCHSHHSMGVSPSGQDVNQFTIMINNAIDQNNLKPQIMLIFNKKDEYYNRLWDPENDIIWENVPLMLQGYDFENLTKEATKKFKKKVYPKTFSWGSNKKSSSNNKLNPYMKSSQSSIFSQPYQPLNLVSSPEMSHYDELFSEIYSVSKKYVNCKPNQFSTIFNWYMNTLHDCEIVPLYHWLNNDLTSLCTSLAGHYDDVTVPQLTSVFKDLLLGKKKTKIKDITAFLTVIDGISLEEIPSVAKDLIQERVL